MLTNLDGSASWSAALGDRTAKRSPKKLRKSFLEMARTDSRVLACFGNAISSHAFSSVTFRPATRAATCQGLSLWA